MRRVTLTKWPQFLVLIFMVADLQAQVTWVPHTAPNAPVPHHAIVAGREHGTRLYVCRARLMDGVHPGKSTGSTCIVSYKGKALIFQKSEFATAPHYGWSRDRWKNGVIAGQQHGKIDLYVCRARVIQDAIDYGFIPGKAYRRGPHTGHCYVPFRGKELDFKGHFELLHTSLRKSLKELLCPD